MIGRNRGGLIDLGEKTALPRKSEEQMGEKQSAQPLRSERRSSETSDGWFQAPLLLRRFPGLLFGVFSAGMFVRCLLWLAARLRFRTKVFLCVGAAAMTLVTSFSEGRPIRAAHAEEGKHFVSIARGFSFPGFEDQDEAGFYLVSFDVGLSYDYGIHHNFFGRSCRFRSRIFPEGFESPFNPLARGNSIQ